HRSTSRTRTPASAAGRTRAAARRAVHYSLADPGAVLGCRRQARPIVAVTRPAIFARTTAAGTRPDPLVHAPARLGVTGQLRRTLQSTSREACAGIGPCPTAVSQYDVACFQVSQH